MSAGGAHGPVGGTLPVPAAPLVPPAPPVPVPPLAPDAPPAPVEPALPAAPAVPAAPAPPPCPAVPVLPAPPVEPEVPAPPVCLVPLAAQPAASATPANSEMIRSFELPMVRQYTGSISKLPIVIVVVHPIIQIRNEGS